MSVKRILVTGGAGFIGSHLVDRLMENEFSVHVIDNLSTGRLDNIRGWIKHDRFKLVVGDLLDPLHVKRAIDNVDVVFHLAACSNVRIGAQNPTLHFNNIIGTFNLLEQMRKSDSPKTVIFISTSSVYGDAQRYPSPESYGPLLPISTYASSKVSCEAIISAYWKTFGLNGTILRICNVVGTRNKDCVIYDFIMKLLKNPKELEILGNGSQKRSYMYIEDCVDAFLFVLDNMKLFDYDVFNVGPGDCIDVRSVSKIVIEAMDLRDVKLKFTGGIQGRGWLGDTRAEFLNVSKIKSLGWSAKYKSKKAVKLATNDLIIKIKQDSAYSS